MPLFTTHVKMGMCIRMTRFRKKIKAFRLNSKKIKQVTGIQLNFILEIKLQMEHFLEKT